jgi:hypothetical protein
MEDREPQICVNSQNLDHSEWSIRQAGCPSIVTFSSFSWRTAKSIFILGGKFYLGRKNVLRESSYIFGRDSIHDLFSFGKGPLTTMGGRGKCTSDHREQEKAIE